MTLRTLLLASFLTLLGTDVVRGADPDRELLQRHGIAADAASLLRYLRDLQPSQAGQKRIRDLIKQLGAEQFRDREVAENELRRLTLLASAELERAERSPDAEVQLRAGRLLDELRAQGVPLLTALFRVVQQLKLTGAVPELLRLLPILPADHLRIAARETALELTRPEDADAIRKLLRAPEVRAAALLAFARASKTEAVSEAEKHLDAVEDVVSLAAARVLAQFADRQCLQSLVKLLESEEIAVRAEAAAILKTVTGQQFTYAAYDEPNRRKEGVALWRKWVRDNKGTKLALLGTAVTARTGRLLLCLFSPFAVKEIDAAGKTVFTSDRVGAPCGCQALPNGLRVFADWENNSVVELDPAGKEVWRKSVPGTPNCLGRLSDGRTLVGLFGQSQVCEIDREGKVVWQVKVDGQPTDTRRLPNGRTLVGLYGRDRVIEIDRDGKEVWTLENVPSPESARRLTNGNTLVASSTSNRVLEFDPTGKLVWSAEDLPRAYDALELENGHILVGYEKGLRELTRAGKVVRDLPLGTVRRIDAP